MKLDKNALVELIKEERIRLDGTLCDPPLAESKDYKRLAKKWLSEDKKNKFTGYLFVHGRRTCETHENSLKDILTWACDPFCEEFDVENRDWYVQIMCPNGGSFNLDVQDIRRGCPDEESFPNWTGPIPKEYYENCSPAIAESKDYKRLASKWLSEKRKISAEKNSRFLLSEAKAKIRSETRDLSRLVMQAVKMNVNDAIAKQKRLRSASGFRWPFKLVDLIAVSGKDLPTSLQKLGVKEVRVRFTPDNKLPRDRFAGEGYFDETGKHSMPKGRGVSIDGPRGPTIEININYSPETRASGFIRNYSNIYHNIQEVVHHELRHMWQRFPTHLPEWTGMLKHSVSSRKNYFLYLMTEHETDSWIRGLAYRAKKARRARKNPLITFEYLIDQKLTRNMATGHLTKKQAEEVRKKWMDHAMRQIPCSLNSKGLPINPKGCGFSKKRKKERANKKELRRLQQKINDNPKMKEQFQKEIAALHDGLANAKPKPGVFRKIVSKLPLVGGILTAAGIVYFADEAYAKGGAKGLAEYGAVTAVDLTPVIGDIKGLFDTMAAILMRKGRTALKADPAFFSPARGKL